MCRLTHVTLFIRALTILYSVHIAQQARIVRVERYNTQLRYTAGTYIAKERGSINLKHVLVGNLVCELLLRRLCYGFLTRLADRNYE